MNIKEIPLKIFEKISGDYGVEAPDWLYKGKEYKVSQIIDSVKKELMGFMCYREDKEDGFSILYFWLVLPKEDDYDAEPLLAIKAGPVDTGVWAYGQGCRMQEKLILHFPEQRIAGDLSLNKIIGRAIIQVAELAQLPECERAEYWQKERKPEGNYYTSPP